MQSWHKYPGTNKVVHMGNAQVALTPDDRVGFRWDGGWADNRSAWTKRYILKMTILELSQPVTAGQTDGWDTALLASGNVHDAGDMFVRAEIIQLKPGTPASEFTDSRNYV
jgi:hypothetical protein